METKETSTLDKRAFDDEFLVRSGGSLGGREWNRQGGAAEGSVVQSLTAARAKKSDNNPTKVRRGEMQGFVEPAAAGSLALQRGGTW